MSGQLDAEFLSETLADFFTDQGWGRLEASRLGDSVLALDSAEWAEAVETVAFGLDGKAYKLDLNKRNAAALRKLLRDGFRTPYVELAKAGD